eukprot:m.478883 g.478883  ORF g.478883 m.478883 type:complete len:178 (-) comp21695_c1_seq20:2641-3174(-)
MLTWPVFWIVAALATILYYIEKSDFARSMPIGNVLRKRYDSHAELPMLHGKVAVVTGANSGLGYETARVLGGRLGATVVMVTRDSKKGRAARDRILQQYPSADLRIQSLDLSDFSSVRQAGRNISAEFERIDIIVCRNSFHILWSLAVETSAKAAHAVTDEVVRRSNNQDIVPSTEQ